MKSVISALFLLLLALATPAMAEQVEVKYRGAVTIDSFACQTVTRSSLVTRVCYHEPTHYLIVGLKGVYYHYCEVDAATVSAFRSAESMGRFYNKSIKDSGTSGIFSCREKVLPEF